MNKNQWQKIVEFNNFKLLIFGVAILAILFSFVFFLFGDKGSGVFKIALTPPNLSSSTKTDNDADNIIVPGQTITYTLNINNTGGSAANGLTITDKIRVRLGAPFNFIYTNCGAGHSESFSSPDLTISNIDVAAGSTCMITYNATVNNPINDDDPDNITITNAAKITPKYGSGTITSDTLTIDVTPNLSTSTKEDNDSDNDVRRGQIITFTVKIKNTGDGSANGVTLNDILDSALEDLSISSINNCGSVYTDNSTANPDVVNIVNLRINSGATCRIIFTAKVKGNSANGTTISNTVTISAANEGGVGASPSSDILTVLAPDLSTSTKTDNDADNFINPGQTVTYTLTIPNSGGRNADNLTVTDAVDSHFGTPFNITYSNCGVGPGDSFAAPVLTFSNIDITVSAICAITYDVIVNNQIIDPSPESITITNSADIAPKHGSGTISADTLTIDVTPDFSTSTKTDDDVDDFISTGQTITYTVNIINSGDGTATGVDIDDAMDGNLENLSVISITNCGGAYTDTSTTNPPVLDINNMIVDPGINCVLVFTAKVRAGIGGGTKINNTATISAANEGGIGFSPSSNTLQTPSGKTCVAPSDISVKINGDAEKTGSRDVIIDLTYKNASEVIASENPNFTGADYKSVSTSMPFTLSDGVGIKTVYLIFKSYCAASPVIADTIIYEVKEDVLPKEEILEPEPEKDQPPPEESGETDSGIIEESNPICTEEIDCTKVTYDLYIILPDGTERHSNSNYVRIERQDDGSILYKFEDRGIDIDYNDVIFKVDARDCREVVISEVSVNARLHHKVRIKIFYSGIFKKDILLWEDSHKVVGKIINLGAYSFVCAVQESGVTVFEDINYGGRSKTFYIGKMIQDLRGIFFDNIISSFKIFGNAVVKFFRNTFYQGDSEIFVADNPNLRGSSIGNDTISSLQISTGTEEFLKTEKEIVCSSGVMFTEYLRPGSRGAEVAALQSLLKCLGYLAQDLGPLDSFESLTFAAVKKFQSDNGLPAVGFVGPRTREILNTYLR